MTNSHNEKRIEQVEKFVGNVQSKVVLDVGVNSAVLSDRIHAKNILKLDVVKEASPDLLCDLNKEVIPLEDEKVDVVIAGEILEHLNNPYRVTREFYRVLRPRGALVITVPNVCSLVNRIKMLFGQLPGHCSTALDSEHFQDPEKHQNDFNVKSISDVLTKAGFKIEGITSNGIITHSKIVFAKCPASFGEVLIIKARKE